MALRWERSFASAIETCRKEHTSISDEAIDPIESEPDMEPGTGPKARFVDHDDMIAQDRGRFRRIRFKPVEVALWVIAFPACLAASQATRMPALWVAGYCVAFLTVVNTKRLVSTGFAPEFMPDYEELLPGDPLHDALASEAVQQGMRLFVRKVEPSILVPLPWGRQGKVLIYRSALAGLSPKGQAWLAYVMFLRRPAKSPKLIPAILLSLLCALVMVAFEFRDRRSLYAMIPFGLIALGYVVAEVYWSINSSDEQLPRPWIEAYASTPDGRLVTQEVIRFLREKAERNSTTVAESDWTPLVVAQYARWAGLE